MRELQLAEPAAVRLGPVRAGKGPTMPQQKAQQLLPCLALVLGRLRPHAHQIAHRLVRFIRNPHLGQLAGPQQLRQHHGIAPVGLDLVAGLPRDQRRRHHIAAMAEARRQPIEVVAQRPGLVGEMQLLATLAELPQHRPDRLGRIGNGAEKLHRRRRLSCDRRHRDRLLVDVQANENGSLCHDPPPVSGALPRSCEAIPVALPRLSRHVGAGHSAGDPYPERT